MVKRLGKTVDDDAKGNAPHWNNLPNEVRHNVIVQAITDRDAWQAAQTFSSLLVTDKRLHADMQFSPVKRFRKALVELGAVSQGVLAKAIPDSSFSSDGLAWDQRNAENEAEALAPILRSLSPTNRTEIFLGISELPIEGRIRAYSRLVEQRDLFNKQESDQMLGEALDVFLDTPAHQALSYTAAGILAVGHDDLSQNARNQVRQLCTNIPRKREQLGESVTQVNPSLLKHDEIRKMVRADFEKYEIPHQAVAALASYIDKNDRSEADFLVEKSLSYFGANSVDGEHNKYAAIAIAKLSNGNFSDKNRDRIRQLRESNTEEGHELNAAFEGLRPAALSPASPKSVRAAARGYMLDLVNIGSRTEDFTNPVDGRENINAVNKISEGVEKHMNSARQALIDTLRDPHTR